MEGEQGKETLTALVTTLGGNEKDRGMNYNEEEEEGLFELQDGRVLVNLH